MHLNSFIFNRHIFLLNINTKCKRSYVTIRYWKHSKKMVEINVNKDVFMHHERVLNVIFDGFWVEWNVHMLQQCL